MVNIAFGVEFFRPFFWLLQIFIRRILFVGEDVKNILFGLFKNANICEKVSCG
jgi:hypothetical protein